MKSKLQLMTTTARAVGGDKPTKQISQLPLNELLVVED